MNMQTQGTGPAMQCCVWLRWFPFAWKKTL